MYIFFFTLRLLFFYFSFKGYKLLFQSRPCPFYDLSRRTEHQIRHNMTDYHSAKTHLMKCITIFLNNKICTCTMFSCLYQHKLCGYLSGAPVRYIIYELKVFDQLETSKPHLLEEWVEFLYTCITIQGVSLRIIDLTRFFFHCTLISLSYSLCKLGSKTRKYSYQNMTFDDPLT